MSLEKRNICVTAEERMARTLQKANTFISVWSEGKHEERQEAQQFEKEFLNIFGLNFRIAKLEHKLRGEDKKINYVDLFWPGELLIEMKSTGSPKYVNGEADEQVFDYVHLIKKSVYLPKVVMISDFNNVRLFDMRPYIKAGSWNGERPEPKEFPLKELTKDSNFSILQFLAGREDLFCREQPEVSLVEAEELGKLYNLLVEKRYNEHDRILFIMRIMFCLFAENSHIFKDNQFSNFILESIYHRQAVSERLLLLFEQLNIDEDKRVPIPCPWDDSSTDPVLLFPYVGGDLFGEDITTPPLNDEEIEEYIINNCSTIDWSKVSPSIFGALFQSIRTKKERRKLGKHYTSVENIEKVIDPLFIDDLNNEFQNIINDLKGCKESRLLTFQDKLKSLQLLDPACGCGNFLIVAYQRLRDLEFRIIKEIYTLNPDSVQQIFDSSLIRKVRLGQLHGIEIDPFPRMIAITAAWLQDHLENERLSSLVGKHIPTIPLREVANIIQGNALQLDWEVCFPDMEGKEFNYIFGNPPFNGARTMNKEQKEDMKFVFNDLHGLGDLDYVTAWYWKAADYMQKHNSCISAYVSTNSITQGQQVSILWEPLLEKVDINFARRTFKWVNEAKGMADVYCVIIGMVLKGIYNKHKKNLWDEDGKLKVVDFINPYLLDSEIVFIKNLEHPICDVPKMKIGNQLIDDGNYIFTKEEMDDFIDKEPKSRPYFHIFIGAKEFLHNANRYILIVNDIPPNLLNEMPYVIERIKSVQEYRKRSRRLSTIKIADTPKEFQRTFIPKGNYIALPEISSEKRFYIPIDILSKDFVSSNRLKIIDSSSLYLFGILTSSVHMIWMRLVAGRLEMRYTYSIGIVYNNFPWPEEPKVKDKSNIETLASTILNVRKKYSSSCLADLYDPISMPTDLLKAHKNLDKAVLKLYGLKAKATDEQILTKLFELYKKYSQND